MNKISFKQVKHDSNGNPRYVCHFLNLLSPSDEAHVAQLVAKEKAQQYMMPSSAIDLKYQIAIENAKKLGGRKFHNKQYGGGIVFSTYNLHDLNLKINKLFES